MVAGVSSRWFSRREQANFLSIVKSTVSLATTRFADTISGIFGDGDPMLVTHVLDCSTQDAEFSRYGAGRGVIKAGVAPSG